MTAPERVYWSMVPDDAPYEPMGGAWDKGIWWLSVDEPSATETLGIEKWRARGCEVAEYVPRALYDAAVAERDEAQYWRERHCRDAEAYAKRTIELAAERDAARAEVERLKAELETARKETEAPCRG